MIQYQDKMILKSVILSLMASWLTATSVSEVEAPVVQPKVYGVQDTAHRLSVDELRLTELGVDKVMGETINFGGQVRAGVVPHHLLAGEMIGKVFKGLESQTIETFVVVGPDHTNQGKGDRITSLQPWGTPYGQVEVDEVFVSTLLESGLVVMDDERMMTEHSMYSLMAFIKQFHPGARVVPIALGSGSSIAEIEVLVKKLSEGCQHNCVVVGSIDFSHYLKAAQARDNDAVTWELISGWRYEELMGKSDAFVDSPASLVTVMKFAEVSGARNIEVVDHTNATEILNDPTVSTTSYFSLVFKP